MNNTTSVQPMEPAVGIFVTVVGLVFSGLIVIANTITLIAVCDVKLERQKKQVISLLIANLYTGILNLPLSLLRINKLEIFNSHYMCVLAFGIYDFGDLILATCSAGLTLTIFLTVKFPFKSDLFLRWETRIVVIVWVFPVCYTVSLFAGISREVMDIAAGRCNWEILPDWYFYLNTAVLLVATCVPFGLAMAVLGLAWRQAVTVTSLEMATREAPSARSVSLKVKHRRLAKLTVAGFALIWIPLVVTEIVGYSWLDYSEIALELVYISVLCMKASLPLFFSYTFSGVKPQVLLLLKKLRVWKNSDEQNANTLTEITISTNIRN